MDDKAYLRSQRDSSAAATASQTNSALLKQESTDGSSAQMVTSGHKESTNARHPDRMQLLSAAALRLPGDASFSTLADNEDDADEMLIDPAAAAEQRRRNAIYSKRKYYKKKGEVNRLEATKSDLIVANERLKAENQLLERILLDAQSKVLLVESMPSTPGMVNASLQMPSQQALQALPLMFQQQQQQQQYQPAFLTAPMSAVAAGTSASATPVNSDIQYSQLLNMIATSGSSANNGATNATSMSTPSASQDVHVRIQQARAALIASREEEQLLLQLLSSAGGSMPATSVQVGMNPSLHTSLPLQLLPFLPSSHQSPMVPTTQPMQQYQTGPLYSPPEQPNVYAYQQQFDQQKQELLRLQQNLVGQLNSSNFDQPALQSIAAPPQLQQPFMFSPPTSTTPETSTQDVTATNSNDTSTSMPSNDIVPV